MQAIVQVLHLLARAWLVKRNLLNYLNAEMYAGAFDVSVHIPFAIGPVFESKEPRVICAYSHRIDFNLSCASLAQLLSWSYYVLLHQQLRV
jgi:hypothetical protein